VPSLTLFITPLIVANRFANCNTSHSIVICSPSMGGRKYVTLRFLVTPVCSQAFLQAKMAMLVPLSKKVAIAPPCVLLVVRLLLLKSGTARDQVILALLVADSLVTELRIAFLTKLPSMFSAGIESPYAPTYERILSAADLSASDCIVLDGQRKWV